MGTPDFAVAALRALIEKHDVVGVVTNPDRPSGRGKNLTPPPVKVAALEHGIDVYQPKKLRKNDDAFHKISSWNADIAVVAAYGQILPQRFLDIPRLGCVNVHASLLPLLRGAAPINWAIVRGHKESGVTTMQMEKGLDTGPMLMREVVDILPTDTAQDLHDKLSQLGADMIVPTIEGLADGTLKAEVQDHDRSTYAPMMKKTDGKIDWSKSAIEINNLIRGMNPWPGAYAEHGEDKIKFHSAEPIDGSGKPGEVTDVSGQLLVGTGAGLLRVLEIQRPGSKRVSGVDFVNGLRVEPGFTFS